ncbi:MAG: DUF6778 family protein [Pseudomonadota bacterium]
MHRRFLIMGAPALLAACSSRWSTNFDTQLTPDVTRSWRLNTVQVTVPAELTVSEANRLAPNADIVWHGEPRGNRRKQVASIVEDGITSGASALQGSQDVTFAVTLQEFHAVTPAAVNTAPGAVHNIAFTIQGFDSETVAPVTEPEFIKADLPAYTGAAAVVAAQEGQTQKVRITNHLARVTQSWLGIGEDVRGDFSGFGR